MQLALRISAETINVIDDKRGDTSRSEAIRNAIDAQVLGVAHTPAGALEALDDLLVDILEGTVTRKGLVERVGSIDETLGVTRPEDRARGEGRWAGRETADNDEINISAGAVRRAIKRTTDRSVEVPYTSLAEARKVVDLFWKQWTTITARID